ncbi:MAG: hypothetical protein FJ215_05045 [Ignavibacteria bacterium]|nr:hypothetical protein [Ignavibacteria bacterium]
MTWLDEIRIELGRAHEAQRVGNESRVRVCARRAAGIAVAELSKHRSEYQHSGSIMEQLASFGSNTRAPRSARQAASRLAARLNEKFVSPSKNPVDDALIIITFVQQSLKQS